MTDIVERLQSKKRNATDEEDDALDEIQSLRQQLAEAKAMENASNEHANNVLKMLAECQAGKQELLGVLEFCAPIAYEDEQPKQWARYMAAEKMSSDSTTLDPAVSSDAALQQQLAECQAREKVLRDALTWYGEEAAALAVNMTAKNDMAVLASVHVLALDAGKRASAMPSDSTALDTMLKAAKLEGWMNGLASAQAETDSMKKQWQREALLEAADFADGWWVDAFTEYQSYKKDIGDELRKKAKEND